MKHLMTLVAGVLIACGDGQEQLEPRALSTIATESPEQAAADEVLALQQRLFEALASGDEDLPRYLDLSFSFNDQDNPVPAAAAVGSGYLPGWRERPGLNYYQFLERERDSGASWLGRTLEVAWILPSVALVVAHHDEKDPVFTEWARRDGEWKAVRLTINAPDSTLQLARESRVQ